METHHLQPTPAQPCWGCQTPCDNPHACERCGVILPSPRAIDHFDVLQIERRYLLDGASLRRSYLDLSRKFHPDRFGQRSVKERRLAVEKSASINTAYKTLLDPIKRAEYLLSKEAGMRELEKLRATPEVLEMVLETRERLADLRDAPKDVAQRQLQQISDEATQKEAALLSELESLFSRFDQGDANTAKDVEQVIVLYRYNRGILQEANALLSVIDGVS